MNRRLVGIVLTIGIAGCGTGRAGMLGGAATTVLGVVVTAQQTDSCNPDRLFCALDPQDQIAGENRMHIVAGTMLVGAGLAWLVAAALTMPAEQTPVPEPLALTPSEPTTVKITTETTVTVPVTSAAPTPAEDAIVSRPENRLAMQASTAASVGNCAGAIASATRLAEIDPDLYFRLRQRDTALAACYR